MPEQVRRIDYYQRTDQALSQFLGGASSGTTASSSSDVTTYLHGDGLLTLRVARLPEGQELPGGDAGQIWFWLRPRQVRGGRSRCDTHIAGCSQVAGVELLTYLGVMSLVSSCFCAEKPRELF